MQQLSGRSVQSEFVVQPTAPLPANIMAYGLDAGSGQLAGGAGGGGVGDGAGVGGLLDVFSLQMQAAAG